MRGADTFTEGLFTLKKLDDFVPANHPLRVIRNRLRSNESASYVIAGNTEIAGNTGQFDGSAADDDAAAPSQSNASGRSPHAAHRANSSCRLASLRMISIVQKFVHTTAQNPRDPFGNVSGRSSSGTASAAVRGAATAAASAAVVTRDSAPIVDESVGDDMMVAPNASG